MSDGGFWHRMRKGRLAQVLIVYLGISWLLLQVVGELREALDLPAWIGPITLILLLVGLFIILATAWVQSHPLVERREAAAEVPGSWELDLRELKESVARGQMPHLTWTRAILGGVFAFSLLFGFAGLYVVLQDRGRSFAPEEAIAEQADPGIAFLPFEVSGPELEHLREGMVSLLFMSLDGAAGLRAIDNRTVLAQWDQRVGPDARADLETSLGVAEAAGARFAFVGVAVDVGSYLQLAGDIYEVPGGASLGRARAEGSPDSLPAIVEDLAVETLGALAQAGVETVPKADLRGVTTHSLPALTAYLEGEAHFRRGEFEASIPHFEAALEADSTFALAHYRIASAIGWTEGTGAGSLGEHLAAALAGNLTPRKRLLVRAGRLESLEPLEELEELVRRHPDDAEAWFTLGDLLVHAGLIEADGALERATEAFQRAAALDPGFAPYTLHLIDFAFAGYEADEARRWVGQYGRASPGSAADRTHRILYRLLFEPAADPLRFEAAIDSLTELGRLERVLPLVGQPRASGVGIAYHLRRAEQTGELHRDICWRYALAEGRWRDFLSYATDPRLAPATRYTCLFQAYSREYPVPDSLLEKAEAWAWEPHPLGPGATGLLYAGAYAASKGRWEEHERWLAALRDRPDDAHLVPILEGYGQWRSGELEQARETLESAPQWPPVRFWLGRLNLELGRPDLAARYFSSFFNFGMPWTRSLYYLGLAYEEMSELEKAQQAYAEYLDIWKNAEPELEPLREQARLRLEAILAARG